MRPLLLSIDALWEVSELNSNTVARNYSILASPPIGSAPWKGVILVKMLQFLAIIFESSSETSHSASNDSTDGCAMLEISEIDHHGE